MKPYVMLYVTNVPRSRAWYERLGFSLRRVSRQGSWAELAWGDFLLFLHGKDQPGPARFALPGFEATEPLEHLAQRLSEQLGTENLTMLDKGFGHTLALSDPDGYEWLILEHEPELYA